MFRFSRLQSGPFPHHNPVHEESGNPEVGEVASLSKTVALVGREKMRVCGCLLAGIGDFDVRPVVALHSHRSTINPAHPLFGCAFF
jgi:hypothetical protein